MRGKLLAPLEDDPSNSWTAVFIYVHGDLDFFANGLGIRHWQSPMPCGLCNCNRILVRDGGAPWNDFSSSPSWLNLVLGLVAWLEVMRVGKYHPLLDMDCAGPDMVAIDTLHTVDHDGVASHIAGNSLAEIVDSHVLPGCRTIADKMNYINVRLDNWKSGTGCKANIPKLKHL